MTASTEPSNARAAFAPATSAARADTPPAPRIAAAYARKSNPGDEAVEEQLDRCAGRAKADGWLIPDQPGFRFGEDNVSGARVADRPGLNALLDVIRSGRAPFHRLYVREIDRLTRADDPRFTQWFEYEAKRFGVDVCYVKEEKHVDVGTEQDRGLVTSTFVLRAVETLAASDERRKIVSRTREGSRRRVLRGCVVGPYAPYATARWLVALSTGEFVQPVPGRGSLRLPGHAVRLRWVPALLPHVRAIFDALDRGDSLKSVARAMTDRGATPPAGAGAWTARAVRRIAADPIYVGDLFYGRKRARGVVPAPAHEGLIGTTDPLLVQGVMPDPPVTRAQFERVERRLGENCDVRERRMATRPAYPLSGLLRCAGCGVKMHGHTTPARSGRRGARRYYLHPDGRSKARPPCPHRYRYVRADPLDASLEHLVRATLADAQLLNLAARELDRLLGAVRTTSHADEIGALEARIAKVDASADRAAENASTAETAEAHALHMRTAQRLAQQVTEERARLDALRAREAQLQGAASTLPTAERRLARLRAALDGAGAEDRRRIWEALIARIDVDLAAHTATTHVRVPPRDTRSEVPR